MPFNQLNRAGNKRSRPTNHRSNPNNPMVHDPNQFETEQEEAMRKYQEAKDNGDCIIS